MKQVKELSSNQYRNLCESILSLPRRSIYALVNVQDKILYLGIARNTRSKIVDMIANPDEVSVQFKKDLHAGKIEIRILEKIESKDIEADMEALELLMSTHKDKFLGYKLYRKTKNTLKITYHLTIATNLKEVYVYARSARKERTILGVFANMAEAKAFKALCDSTRGQMLYACNSATREHHIMEKEIGKAKVRTPMYV
jgi:hypothetical protein